MKPFMWFVALTLTIGTVAALPGSALAAAGQCTEVTNVYGTSISCHYTHDQLVETVSKSPSNVSYQVIMQCLSDNVDGVCNNPRICAVPPGSVLYAVEASTDGGPFLKVGDVCLLSGQDQDFSHRITIQMVEEAFQSLDWPTSPTVVQPPNGRTLVNLAT